MEEVVDEEENVEDVGKGQATMGSKPGEFHSAARQLSFSGSDTDSSDSGEALPYPLSPLLALPAGAPFSRFIPRMRSSINTLDSYLSPSNPIARLPVVAAVRPLPSLTHCPNVHFHTHTHLRPLMIPLARSSYLSTIPPPSLAHFLFLSLLTLADASFSIHLSICLSLKMILRLTTRWMPPTRPPNKSRRRKPRASAPTLIVASKAEATTTPSFPCPSATNFAPTTFTKDMRWWTKDRRYWSA
jgi:hypothetical protein